MSRIHIEETQVTITGFGCSVFALTSMGFCVVLLLSLVVGIGVEVIRWLVP